MESLFVSLLSFLFGIIVVGIYAYTEGKKDGAKAVMEDVTDCLKKEGRSYYSTKKFLEEMKQIRSVKL